MATDQVRLILRRYRADAASGLVRAVMAEQRPRCAGVCACAPWGCRPSPQGLASYRAGAGEAGTLVDATLPPPAFGRRDDRLPQSRFKSSHEIAKRVRVTSGEQRWVISRER